MSKKKSSCGDADNNQYYLPHLKWDETVDKGGNSRLLGGKPQLPGGKQELPQVVNDINQGGKPRLPGVVNDVYPNYTNITIPNNYSNPTIERTDGQSVDNLYPSGCEGNAAEETAVTLAGGGQSLELSAEFERFWQAYPRKNGKPRAVEAWKIVLAEGYRAIDLIVAAGKYSVKIRVEGTAEQYMKMPHTFLTEHIFVKYLPPCPKCGGSGFVGNKDGEVELCECKKTGKTA